MKKTILILATAFMFLGNINAQISEYNFSDERSVEAFETGFTYTATRYTEGSCNINNDGVVTRNSSGNITNEYEFPNYYSQPGSTIRLITKGTTNLVSGSTNFINSYFVETTYSLEQNGDINENLYMSVWNMHNGPQAADSNHVYKILGAMDSNFHAGTGINGLGGTSAITYPTGATGYVNWIAVLNPSNFDYQVVVELPEHVTEISVLANGNLLIKEVNVTSQGVGQIISEILKSALEAGYIEYVRRTPVIDGYVYLSEAHGKFFLGIPDEMRFSLLDENWDYTDTNIQFSNFRGKEAYESGENIVILGGDLTQRSSRETRYVVSQNLEPIFVSGAENFEKSDEFIFPYDGVVTPIVILDVDDTTITSQMSWRGDVYRYGSNILALIDGQNFPNTGNGCEMKTLNVTVDYSQAENEKIVGVVGGDVISKHEGYKFDVAGNLIPANENDIALVLSSDATYPATGQDLPGSYYQAPTNIYSEIYGTYIDWVPAWTAIHEPTVEVIDGGIRKATVIFKERSSGHFEGHPQNSSIVNIYLLKGEELGTTDVAFDGLILYPNPVSDNLLINSPLDNITSVSVVDVLGRMVNQTANQSGIEEISFSNLKSGMYFVSFSDGTKTITKKIIKE